MLQRRRSDWGIVLTMLSAYSKSSRIGRQFRERRTESAEITPASSSRTPGTPRRALTLRSTSGYTGIRLRKDKWVCEMRISETTEKKMWLGSYDTEKEAALAYDAGLHHCSTRRVKQYNFSSSPRLLGPQARLEHLSSVDRRFIVKVIAEEYARNYYTRDIE
ncbi:ethylene-responsive transcription factor ERF015-like [Physcomitrium patens]|uniref:ethylene-responsive transcription factor ERF015-like n=1 Tax=Physcomitrium patens TaxID=3218 RepID=UPI00024B1760